MLLLHLSTVYLSAVSRMAQQAHQPMAITGSDLSLSIMILQHTA